MFPIRRTNSSCSENMFPTCHRLFMFSFADASTFFVQTRQHYPTSGTNASSGGLFLSRQWRTCLSRRQILLISRRWHTCPFWRQTLLIFRQWHSGKPYFYPASGIHASSGGDPFLYPASMRQSLFLSRQWHTCLFWRLTYTILRQRPWLCLTSDTWALESLRVSCRRDCYRLFR